MPAGRALDERHDLAEGQSLGGDGEGAGRDGRVQGGPRGVPSRVVDARGLEALVPVAPEGRDPGVVVEVDDRAGQGEHVEEGPVEHVHVLHPERGDRLVGLAPQVEREVLAGRRLEEVEGEVRRQDAANAVLGGGAGERDLTVDDDLATTLERGDHDVDVARGAIEARGVGHVALHEHGAALDEPVERGTLVRVVERPRADEQPQGDVVDL